MSNEMTHAADKWLRADGSVTTTAGEEILPADRHRALEYTGRVAAVDKWLHPDGSVTDSTGRVILEADESRTRDYESRAPGTALYPPTGSGFNGNDETNVAVPAFMVYDVPSAAFLYPWIEIRDDNTITMNGAFSVSDTGSAVLK